MPDPVLLLESSAVAAALTALALLLGGWPWRKPRLPGAAAGAAVGVGAGLLVGAWALGLAPHWPPREDQDRLLLVLMPAAVVVEIAAALGRQVPWLGWPLRVALACAAAPVLLYGSVYVSDAAGPGTREWSPIQTGLILGGLAVALATNWALLDRLAARGAGRAVVLALAIAAAGAGLAVMLSGYATGGQLGFPLGTGLGGAAVASLALAGAAGLRGAAGVGAVGLFGLLVAARFFGDLTTANAALLFAAPLLAWLPELLPTRRLGPRGRGIARLALPVLPVALALALAVQRFTANSAAPSRAPSGKEASVQDYLNFGK